MPKIHELLAVEANLESQANKVRTDLVNTFEKKRHLFEEKRVTFTPNTEGADTVTEEQSTMESTVQKELDWIQGHITKALDVSFQIAMANTVAKADVVLDDEHGTVILKDMPATSLLELEKRLAEVRDLVAAIPTLDPAKGFTLDSTRGDGIFVAREVTKGRTKKVPKVIVKYAATVEHPAQTELFHEDTAIGRIQEQAWSGLITPGQKSEMLGRAETLIRAIRAARSRANELEVGKSPKIGATLLKYVFTATK